MKMKMRWTIRRCTYCTCCGPVTGLVSFVRESMSMA